MVPLTLNMKNGLLGEELTLLAPTRTRTSSGGWTDAFAKTATLYGRVSTPVRQSLMERIKGEQPTTAVLAEIAVVETTRVQSRMRVQHGDDVYEVVGIERAGNVAYLAGRLVQ